jgi:hypothetical protein
MRTFILIAFYAVVACLLQKQQRQHHNKRTKQKNTQKQIGYNCLLLPEKNESPGRVNHTESLCHLIR